MTDLCTVAASLNAMNLEDQPKTIGGSLLGLFKCKKLCDVIFTFPDLPDKIEAHELCLRARSPVFEQIFRMRKSGNVQGREIEICEFSPQLFQQFIEFIYSDQVDVDIVGALDLLQLSLKYQVQPLIQRCEEILLAEIPILDSVKVFEAAPRHGRQELMGRAGQIMIKSFLDLVGADALVNAEEETLVYLLESDDLAVKEVGLFQFILVWGKNQVGNASDEELLKNKLKNLIPKIRYTNMAPDEFTKVVIPTGLLSAEEEVSVYSYLCGNEITRRGLKNKFNTTCRKGETHKMVTKIVDFNANQTLKRKSSSGFSKHCMSFTADRTQVDGKARPDYLLKKTLITAIHFRWPSVHRNYSEQYVLNFNVFIGESSGSVEDETFTMRFMKKLSICKENGIQKVSVHPPVELVEGRTYSVIVEDHSTSGSKDIPRWGSDLYEILVLDSMTREANVDFEDVSLTLRDIQTEKRYWRQTAYELALIERIEIGLM